MRIIYEILIDSIGSTTSSPYSAGLFECREDAEEHLKLLKHVFFSQIDERTLYEKGEVL